MAITIKDVAKKANVSISTVSRVINNSKPVSPEIKEKVNKIIEEMNYSPNPVARSLVMRKSRLIGAIVPDIATFYVGEVLNAMEEIAKTYEFDMLLFNSYGDIDREIEMMNYLLSKQVEGLVLMSHVLDSRHFDIIKEHSLPTVLINRKITNESIMTVSINHFLGMHKMTEYLINLGHRRIALIRSDCNEATFGKDQTLGFFEAHKRCGIEVNEDFIFDGNFKWKEAYDKVLNLMKEENPPSAIIAATDDMAIGAIDAVIDSGYRVPEDVSVVGFQNTKIANMFRPKLTTLIQPIYDMGAIGIRLLIKKIEFKDIDNNNIVLPFGFLEADSSKEF